MHKPDAPDAPENPTETRLLRIEITLDPFTRQVAVNGLELGMVHALGMIEAGRAMAIAYFNQQVIAPALAGMQSRIVKPRLI